MEEKKFKVKLKPDVKPFHYPKFGKVWKIPEDEITEKVFAKIKHKVSKVKTEKAV